MDNLSKYNFKSIGYFKNGEKIPSLEKYKLFYGLLILTQNISGVTHAQLPLIGVLKGNGVLQMQYNDNYYPEGSINFIIANNIVTISGGYFNANEERKLYSKLLLYGLEK